MIEYIGSDIVKYAGCMTKVFYPKNMIEVVELSDKIRYELYWENDTTLYPQISLDLFNDEMMSTDAVVALMPSNLIHPDTLLRHITASMGGVEFSGATQIRIDSYQCPIPKEELIEKLRELSVTTWVSSIMDVHENVRDFLRQYYEDSPRVVVNHPVLAEDHLSVGVEFNPIRLGSTLWAMDAAYIFLVTQFCIRNPLVNDMVFLSRGNRGMEYLLDRYYFFSHQVKQPSMVANSYIEGYNALQTSMRQLYDYGRAIYRKMESDVKGVVMVEYNMYGMLEDKFKKDNDDILLPFVPFNGKYYVVCRTVNDFEKVLDVYRTTEGMDILDNARLLFENTPEMKRIQQRCVLKSGGDHLDIMLKRVA